MKFKTFMLAATAALASTFATPAMSKPIKVAIIDTGVAESPLLAGKVIEEHNFNRSQEKGIVSPHGTWVAGVLAANTDANVQFVSLRIDYARTCSFDMPLCHVDGKARAEAVEKAQQVGVDLIVISSAGRFSSNLKKALKSALASGIQVVVSAGNTPGALSFAGAITHPRYHIVGALDKKGKRARFSSTSISPSMVWRLGVDVETQSIDGTVVRVDGTSYAAPLFAAELISKMTRAAA